MEISCHSPALASPVFCGFFKIMVQYIIKKAMQCLTISFQKFIFYFNLFHIVLQKSSFYFIKVALNSITIDLKMRSYWNVILLENEKEI